MSGIGHIDASLRTDQGRVRGHNEDFIAQHEPSELDEATSNGWLYIVADGVGGAAAGEIASQYATERTIYHYLANQHVAEWDQRILQAMRTANADLRDLVAGRPGSNRMATTMVVALLHDDSATIANVGDSRGYHWRAGVLRQITKDHSLVARLVEEGAISAEEAENHPRKNVILHSLGSEKQPQIDLYDVALEPGEQLVLCTDGLTRHVSDLEIADIISKQDPGEATETLIKLANKRGGEDNISVAVLRIGELPVALEDRTGVMIQPQVGRRVRDGKARVRRALWIYTAVLCIVQTIAIILIWYLIAV